MSCAFVVCDVTLNDCPIIYVSDNFQNLTGYSRHEIIGKNCRFLQAPDGRGGGGLDARVRRKPCRLQKAAGASRGARSFNKSLINYRKGGKPFHKPAHHEDSDSQGFGRKSGISSGFPESTWSNAQTRSRGTTTEEAMRGKLYPRRPGAIHLDTAGRQPVDPGERPNARPRRCVDAAATVRTRPDQFRSGIGSPGIRCCSRTRTTSSASSRSRVCFCTCPFVQESSRVGHFRARGNFASRYLPPFGHHPGDEGAQRTPERGGTSRYRLPYPTEAQRVHMVRESWVTLCRTRQGAKVRDLGGQKAPDLPPCPALRWRRMGASATPRSGPSFQHRACSCSSLRTSAPS